MGPSEVIWGHMVPSAAVWGPSESGAIWSLLGPYGPSGAVWGHLEAYGAIWGHLGQYEAFWGCLVPSGATRPAHSPAARARCPECTVANGAGGWNRCTTQRRVTTHFASAPWMHSASTVCVGPPGQPARWLRLLLQGRRTIDKPSRPC